MNDQNHERCGMCITRRERRHFARLAKKRHSGWHCCSIDPRTGARESDLGKHEHSSQSSAHDHATGKHAWLQDPSMTRAVRRRLFPEAADDYA